MPPDPNRPGAKPPEITEEDGWTVRTYRDGSWVRVRQVGGSLEYRHSWGFLEPVPLAVIEQDRAAMRNAGSRMAYAAEMAFKKAFMGEEE